MRRVVLAIAVAAAIPAAAAASPIEITAADPSDISADATVTSTDTPSGAGYFSLQLGDTYVGRTDEALVAAVPDELKKELTVTDLPFGTLQLLLGMPATAGAAERGSVAAGGVAAGGSGTEDLPANPEPASLLLLGTGLAVLAERRRTAARS